MLVQPIVSLCKADGSFPDTQQACLCAFATTDRVPLALKPEDAAPGGETCGHQRVLRPEKIDPFEAGALQQVDFRHQEAGQRPAECPFTALALIFFLHQCLAADRALTRGEGNIGVAGGAGP